MKYNTGWKQRKNKEDKKIDVIITLIVIGLWTIIMIQLACYLYGII